METSARYRRQTLHNRTKLRNADGWQWITVPVGHGQFGGALSEIRIQGDPGWRTRHAKALRFNYESAPFYMYYAPRLHAFWAVDWEYLVDATLASVTLMVELMRLPGEVSPASGGETADSLSGSRNDQPTRKDIVYSQNFDGYLPGMSVIDLLMNHGPEAISVLDAYAGLP